MLNPCGPTATPAIIRPMRCGIRILFRSRGAKRIINSINEKINTESCSGNDKEIFKNGFAILKKQRKMYEKFSGF
jgi:hypothetical protein